MANVYSPPSGFQPPTFNSREEPFDKYQERVDACFCGKNHASGIFVREDGRTLPCEGMAHDG